MRRFLRDFPLSASLAVPFVLVWVLWTLGGWTAFRAERAASPADAFGQDGYIWTWLAAMGSEWRVAAALLLGFVGLTLLFVSREAREPRDADVVVAAQLEQGLTRLRATSEGMTFEGSLLPVSAGAGTVLPFSPARPRLVMTWFGVVLAAGIAINLAVMALVAALD